jgi:hypothetical protein
MLGFLWKKVIRQVLKKAQFIAGTRNKKMIDS